jgi:sugar phosphate isomerase/epimerase
VRAVSLLGSHWTLGVGAYPHSDREFCPHDFRVRVETAARAGFTGLGLYGPDLARVLETYDYAAIKQILADNGIVHLELEWLLDWYRTDQRRVASDAMRAFLLDAAERLEARHLKIADLGNDSVDLPQLTDEFARLCEEAARRGTLVLFELLPPSLTRLPSLDEVLKLTRGAGAANGGTMLDTWHLVRTGTSNADLVAKLRSSDVIGVEINDGLLAAPQDIVDATINHRLLVGSGEFDLPGFVAAMDAVGYEGPYGVEILNAELRERTLEEAATTVYATTAPLFAPGL